MTIWCIALSTDFLIVTSHSIAIADLPSWDISFSKLVIPFHPILISSGALTGNSLWRSNTATDAPDLAREIAKKVKEDFSDKKLPLMIAMINAILEDKKLEVKWEKFN